MKSRDILLPALLLSLLVLALHLSALTYQLYFFYWWFHTIMHVLTGFVLALLILFFATRFNEKPRTFQSLVKLSLPIVLVFAIGWEIFEVMSGLIYSYGARYAVSTIRDIVTGLSGGYIGAWYVSFLNKTGTENNSLESE